MSANEDEDISVEEVIGTPRTPSEIAEDTSPADSDAIGASDQAAREDRPSTADRDRDRDRQQRRDSQQQGIEEGGGEGLASVVLTNELGQEFTFRGPASEAARRAEREILRENPALTAEDIRITQAPGAGERVSEVELVGETGQEFTFRGPVEDVRQRAEEQGVEFTAPGSFESELLPTGEEALQEEAREQAEFEQEIGQGQQAAEQREVIEGIAEDVPMQRETGQGLFGAAMDEVLQDVSRETSIEREFGRGAFTTGVIPGSAGGMGVPGDTRETIQPDVPGVSVEAEDIPNVPGLPTTGTGSVSEGGQEVNRFVEGIFQLGEEDIEVTDFLTDADRESPFSGFLSEEEEQELAESAEAAMERGVFGITEESVEDFIPGFRGDILGGAVGRTSEDVAFLFGGGGLGIAETGAETIGNIPGATEEFGVGATGAASLGLGGEVATEFGRQAEEDPLSFLGQAATAVVGGVAAGRAIETVPGLARRASIRARGGRTVDFGDVSDPPRTLEGGLPGFSEDVMGRPQAARDEFVDQAVKNALGDDVPVAFHGRAPEDVGQFGGFGRRFDAPEVPPRPKDPTGMAFSADLSPLRLPMNVEGGPSIPRPRLPRPRIRTSRIAAEADVDVGIMGGETIPGTRAFMEGADPERSFIRSRGTFSPEQEAFAPEGAGFAATGEVFGVRAGREVVPGRMFRRGGAGEVTEETIPGQQFIEEAEGGLSSLSASVRRAESPSEPFAPGPSFIPGTQDVSIPGTGGGMMGSRRETPSTAPDFEIIPSESVFFDTGRETVPGVSDTSIPGFTSPTSPTAPSAPSAPSPATPSAPSSTIPGIPSSGEPTIPGTGAPGTPTTPDRPTTPTAFIPGLPPSTPGVPSSPGEPFTPGPGSPPFPFIPGFPSGPPIPGSPLGFGLEAEPPEEEVREEFDPLGATFVNPLQTPQEALAFGFMGFGEVQSTPNTQDNSDEIIPNPFK